MDMASIRVPAPDATPRLSRADWVEAALGALLAKGPDAVAIEPIAAALGTTKGSGYWHFANRQDLLTAVLEHWNLTTTHRLIQHVEANGGTARERLGHLLAIVTRAAEESPGDQLVMASHDPTVRQAVQESVDARMGYLRKLCREAGASTAQARTRSVLAYSTYLGYAALCASTPSVVPRSRAERRRTLEAILELAMPTRR